MVSSFEQILLLLMIVVIMLGLGASLSFSDFRQSLRTPKPVVIGLISQYLMMPLIGLSLVLLFQMPPPLALGLMIVACCPSGTTSTLFNYFARGDVALSISLSTVTTALALILLPVLLYVYTTPFTTGADLQVDYRSLMASLLACLVPACVGLYIKRRSARWGKNLEEIGAGIGLLFIVFLLVTWVPKNWAFLGTIPVKIYVSSIALGLVGFVFGYFMSRLLRLSPRWSRTVSLETGIQNTPLAIAIVLLSFPREGGLQSEVLAFPALYSIFIVLNSTWVTYLLRRFTRKEWACFENQQVQKKLYQDGWLTTDSALSGSQR
jgi:bile acid transporter